MNKILDLLYPYAGPCAICGHDDKRHRLADSMIENVYAGDPPEMVAQAYSTDSMPFTPETVYSLVEYASERRRKKKARWPEEPHKCRSCNKKIECTYAPDPYQVEIWHKKIWDWWCFVCYQERIGDI